MKSLISILLVTSTIALADTGDEARSSVAVSVPLPAVSSEFKVPGHPAQGAESDRDDNLLQNHPAVEVALGHSHPDYVGKLAIVGHPAHGFSTIH